jgi:hypothetical protein
MLLLVTGLMAVQAEAFTLTVRDGKTDQDIGVGYRWLVEEDVTHSVTPNVPATNWATKFHKSYMPVVAKGTHTDPLPDLLNNKRYYVSVLPDSGYSLGGGQLVGNGNATVYVQATPIPTAQISVLVFHDNNPINNAPDLPEETPGLEPGQTDMSGFTVKLEDAGGRYGISAGEAMQNAFGHPIGTTYTPGCDPNVSGDACIDELGLGFMLTGPDGEVIFQNMAPGKYGVIAIPPAGQGWQQTATIEGKKVIDAWVKANEPIFFAEFGPPGWHAFIGFTKEFNAIPAVTSGSPATISGTVVNNHLSRPPDTAFYDGAVPPHTTPWVGLNANGGLGPAIYVQRTSEGSFSIPNVPPGSYQLAVFDDNMDLIFNFLGVTVNADGSCATPDGSCTLGNVPTFDWFAKLWTGVFDDVDPDGPDGPLGPNGMWDAGEDGIPEVPVNIRWRDGTLYQSFPTDSEGFAPFDEVFPFFSWLTAEVDFARLKATGATVVADAGGAIDSTDPWSFGGQLNPQLQADGEPFRVETGPVLTQAFQAFLGQTNVIHFGKTSYGPGVDGDYGTDDDENGGISGIVYYSVTRAEDDPELAAPEVWEPGIPGVTVNLYDSTGVTLLASTVTDSWDASLPDGCPGDVTDPFYNDGACYDGMRNWNQVRPGVFDGGYAFNSITVDEEEISPIPAGEYVVEVIPPAGYQIVKSQDKNVDFGDSYIPQPEVTPPQCVGLEYDVPQYLSLFPDVEAPLFDQTLNTCDRKLVSLAGGDNAAADFYLFTEVPIAAHIVGFILDDTGNEFDPNSPQFGEKYAPPWIPVGIYDWTGRLIGETISDQWGRYNALVPSTYTMNLPMPSGASPNMLTTCMNDPNTPTYGGNHNPQYSTFCYTFQYMPGSTTYLDTPVVPVAAFAGPDQFPLDCELPDGTPKIASVSFPGNGVGGGPYMTRTASGNGRSLTIQSVGAKLVPNPDYDGPNGTEEKTISRDYGFGSEGTVQLVAPNGTIYPLTVTSWGNNQIAATVPGTVPTPANNNPAYYQLVVNRVNPTDPPTTRSSVTGVTVQIGLRQGSTARQVTGSIQAAIDTANTNDLILVPPGTYDEFVIMYKPVQLQGWGAGSTTINAVKGFEAERLQAWRNKVEQLVTSNTISLLPGQEALFGGIEPVTFFTEEGAGVLVAARSGGNTRFDFGRNQGARIDGFLIRGADQGGGIVASGYTDYLVVSNNVIKNNSGFFGGGFRSGHPLLDNALVDSDNDNIRVHHNMITQNGGLGGAGGGVALCTGSDNYQVTDNFICGNFNLSDGGGIGHLGLSANGRIVNNDILFNESFNQGLTVHGGGILIAGGGAAAGQLSPGAGSVVIEANRIHGNLAGAGDGGGIALVRINGQDVDGNRNQSDRWYGVDLFDNIITNNVSALAGGGIVLRDTVKANIIHNTVAQNDSTATAGNAFSPGSPDESNPQPAGIVSNLHSSELRAALDRTGNRVPATLKAAYANPRLADNIIWQNRSFHFAGDPTADPPLYALVESAPLYRDLAVIGSGGRLNPEYSVLTSLTGFDGADYSGNDNIAADPDLTDAYFNGPPAGTVILPEPLFVAAAFDEGGNFIQVRFGPLTLDGTDPDTLYHLDAGSSAINAGLSLNATFPALTLDFDGDTRPLGGGVDIGADEAP